ncbi:MAG: hypothetical protein IJT40_01130 [Firmicutes bacterium]|nr:hypothetical protein [Bacillota bacterium]
MKKNMKRSIAAVLAVIMVFTLAACGGTTGNSVNSNTETIVGGWTINTGDLDINSNEEALAAFQKAVEELLGCDYEPVALLATQVVAGTNYCILARTTTVAAQPYTTYQLVYVYADLSGNCEVLKFEDLMEGKLPQDGEILDGGWGVNTGNFDIYDIDEAGEAFDLATSIPGGADYEPVCLMGGQVVAGLNRLYMARKTEDDTAGFVLVEIFSDLEGNSSITMETPIEFSID